MGAPIDIDGSQLPSATNPRARLWLEILRSTRDPANSAFAASCYHRIMALRMLSRVSGLLQPARQSLATDTSRLVCCPEAVLPSGVSLPPRQTRRWRPCVHCTQGIAIRPFSAAAQAAEQPSGEGAKSVGQGWGHTRILDILRSKVRRS
jgi:hypothetical protein